MQIKEYVYDGIKINIVFCGQYFINRENKLSHTSPKKSIDDFEYYVNQ
jgi:hypothetical protein